MARSGAADKTYQVLSWASHYLYPMGEEGARLADPRERLLDIIVPWMRGRL
jgi:hypothetical protein